MFKKFFSYLSFWFKSLLTIYFIGFFVGLYNGINPIKIFFYESEFTNYPDNACNMLKENKDWHKSLVESSGKWGVPIETQLAFIRQESAFTHDARPIRKNKWYEFGKNYLSTSLGFSQAINGTWELYKKETKDHDVNRKSFNDSVHFIGWFNNKSIKELGLKGNDSYNLYLSYHEGWNGYKRQSYNQKPSLLVVAKRVDTWSKKYKLQIDSCQFK